MKMKRILQNFRKGSGRGEVLGTSDLTGRESHPFEVEDEEEDDDTSLYTTNNQQLEVEFNFSEDKKEGDKESTLSETKTLASELSHSKMTPPPYETQHAAFKPQMPQSPVPIEAITEHPPQQQYPPDRYAETRDLVKKFIADIWNRGELDLIPSVCSPSLRCNGNNGAYIL